MSNKQETPMAERLAKWLSSFRRSEQARTKQMFEETIRRSHDVARKTHEKCESWQYVNADRSIDIDLTR